jgi:hypothetical protein
LNVASSLSNIILTSVFIINLQLLLIAQFQPWVCCASVPCIAQVWDKSLAGDSMIGRATWSIEAQLKVRSCSVGRLLFLISGCGDGVRGWWGDDLHKGGGAVYA